MEVYIYEKCGYKLGCSDCSHILDTQFLFDWYSGSPCMSILAKAIIIFTSFSSSPVPTLVAQAFSHIYIPAAVDFKLRPFPIGYIEFIVIPSLNKVIITQVKMTSPLVQVLHITTNINTGSIKLTLTSTTIIM